MPLDQCLPDWLSEEWVSIEHCYRANKAVCKNVNPSGNITLSKDLSSKRRITREHEFLKTGRSHRLLNSVVT